MIDNFECFDCSKNTFTEYYMVYDDIWQLSGLNKKEGKLCIICLENRIGRKLTKHDFPNLYVNKINKFKSDCLINRLTCV